MRGIHLSPVNSPHKGQCRGALVYSLICASTNGWANNRDADDLRRHHAHYDVTVMKLLSTLILTSLKTDGAIQQMPGFLLDRLYFTTIGRPTGGTSPWIYIKYLYTTNKYWRRWWTIFYHYLYILTLIIYIFQRSSEWKYKHRMTMQLSALLALCERNPGVTVGFLWQCWALFFFFVFIPHNMYEAIMYSFPSKCAKFLICNMCFTTIGSCTLALVLDMWISKHVMKISLSAAKHCHVISLSS